MRNPTVRMLFRAVGLGLVLAALPFAFVDGGGGTRSPELAMNELCADGGGSCVWEFMSICGADGSLNYNQYYNR